MNDGVEKMSKRKTPLKISEDDEEESVSEGEEEEAEAGPQKRRWQRGKRIEVTKEKSKFVELFKTYFLAFLIFFLLTGGLLVAALLMILDIFLPVIVFVLATTITIFGTGIAILLIHKFIKRLF